MAELESARVSRSALPESQSPAAALLFGPTASGKTAIAVALAKRLPLEVVSADSRQVYRDLDIGTAKPTPEEQQAVRHHGIDVLDLDQTYNAARFAADALTAIRDIRDRGHIPLVVGGAGFYLKVLEEGLFDPPYTPEVLRDIRRELEGWPTQALSDALRARDPERLAAIHPNDRYRLARALEICIASGRSVTALTAETTPPEHVFVKFQLRLERSQLHQRIAKRTHLMLDTGWIEEVRALLDRGVDPKVPGFATLGYPHVVAHLADQIDHDRLVELVLRDTRRFARHQETWFRKAKNTQVLHTDPTQTLDQLTRNLQQAFHV